MAVTALTSERAGDGAAAGPWAKAGLIITAGPELGAHYAAIMVTGAHGVRMQHDYLHDRAGLPGVGMRWLRLTRSGDTITGEASTDGATWSRVDSVRLPGLADTVQVGPVRGLPAPGGGDRHGQRRGHRRVRDAAAGGRLARRQLDRRPGRRPHRQLRRLRTGQLGRLHPDRRAGSP